MMDWKRGFGFTDRLRAIQSLTTASQQNSSSEAFTEAQNKAKKLENEAYSRATSREEYHQLCQDAIDAAEAFGSSITNATGEVIDDTQDSNWGGGESLGSYHSCINIFDGIHSKVYKSKSQDGTLVALKITVPHLLEPPHNPKREAQLLREAACPNVLPLLGTFNLEGGRFILVSPFKRHDFGFLLRQDILTAAQTKSVLHDMFSALASIHKMGILHRDVKPSNILLDFPEGPAYLADFGIAWKDGSKEAEAADKKITDVGTTCYRSPEILFGFKAYGPALDLWAAGCVVAEAVAVGHKQLFDSGPVGSDLSLIQSIFHTLGTPDEDAWPEADQLPDWGKIEFYKYPPKNWNDILKGAASSGRDLVSKLVRYESKERISATESIPISRGFEACSVCAAAESEVDITSRTPRNGHEL